MTLMCNALPNPANPNRHSAHQIQLLAPIIQEQDWRNPVTLSKRPGLIVPGHGQQDTALLISCAAIPIDEPDHTGKAHSELDFNLLAIGERPSCLGELLQGFQRISKQALSRCRQFGDSWML